MPRSAGWPALLALVCLVLPAPLAAATVIALSDDTPALRFGAEELAAALGDAETAVGDRGDIVARIDPSAVEGQAEAFTIRKTGGRIEVLGDEVGVMYGLIDLADTVALSGRESVQPKRSQPFLAMRGIKWNMPLAGGAYAGADGGRPGEWLWDRGFWEQHLRMMARNRYNVLTLWNGCPYHHLVHLDDVPHATELPREQIDANIGFFRWATRRARELGIQTHLITWNIHIPPSFAEHLGIEAAGVDTPQVRDYTRKAVRALVDTYPDLTAIGTCPGERMSMTAQEKQDWIAQTYLAGIRDASRTVPFFLRYWQGDPEATATTLDRASWPEPVYLAVKFNGEHMYSSPRFHLADHRWLDMAAGRWQVFWHLRNDCIFRLKWGDPAFARETVRNCRADYSCGFFWGSEGLKPGADGYHRPPSDAYARYDFEFQRKAEMYRIWGRLGYDPDTPDEVLFIDYHRKFGDAAAHLAEALSQASRIIPLVTSYHWNYMNGDWAPETNTGKWNTNHEATIRNWRDAESFHSVKEYIWNHTIDDSLISIPDCVALRMTGSPIPAGSKSPLDAASEIIAAADAAEAALRAAGEVADPEAACIAGDVRIYAELGRYYGKKIIAAMSLAEVLIAGDGSAREPAVRLLEECATHWGNVVNIAAEQYPAASWRGQIPQVQADTEYARSAEPLPRAATTWQVTTCDAGTQIPAELDRLPWREVSTSLLAEQGEAVGLREWLNRLNGDLGYGGLDLLQITGGAEAGTYLARRTIDAEHAGTADVIVRAEHPTRVFVNGTLIGAGEVPPGQAAYLTTPVPEGPNDLLVQVMPVGEHNSARLGLEVALLPLTDVAARLECENAQPVGKPMVVVEDAACSGGGYVHSPRDAGRGDNPEGDPIDHGRMVMPFTIERDGEYDIWVRVFWPATTANSYFLQVGDSDVVQFGQDETFGRWHWVKARESYRLAAGDHALVLRTREADTRGDAVVIAPAE